MAGAYDCAMTIYDEIGGAAAVNAAVELFYEKVIGDPQVSGFFAGVDSGRLMGHQRAFIAGALGGPQVYAARDMGAAHASFEISDADFDVVLGHLVSTLEALDVPGTTIEQIAARLYPLRAVIVSRASVT